mgnify:CR=1 FL=1
MRTMHKTHQRIVPSSQYPTLLLCATLDDLLMGNPPPILPYPRYDRSFGCIHR